MNRDKNSLLGTAGQYDITDIDDSQSGDVNSGTSPPPKNFPVPRHQRGGKQRKKKLLTKRSIDGYENSGHEQSDFLFTDGDQSAFEEDEDTLKSAEQSFEKNSDESITNGLINEIDTDTIIGVSDKLSDLAILNTTENNQDHTCIDAEKNNTDNILNNDGEPLDDDVNAHSQALTKKTPRKRIRRKKKNKSPQKVDTLEVDVDLHEDEDDYPSNISSPSTTVSNLKENHGFATNKPKKAQERKRTLEEELVFLNRISPTKYIVQPGFVPNMKVSAEIIVNDDLENLLIQELRDTCCGHKLEEEASFIPALRQAANVAALPGIVKASLAMPDVHSGYGFCIGNVAAFDMDDPDSVISPGGVGFDINCGVRLIRTNLTEKDVDETVREKLAEALFRNIPVGVGNGGEIPCTLDDLDRLLETGVDWAIEKGYAWEEDKTHCEEYGRMETADPKCVSARAKKRGLKQLGTLGAGNHYAEVQIIDEIYHPEAAKAMAISTLGQVCIMIHTGSRGLGHQVATDALTKMDNAMARDHIDLNDRQLSCARISSQEGKDYLGE